MLSAGTKPDRSAVVSGSGSRAPYAFELSAVVTVTDAWPMLKSWLSVLPVWLVSPAKVAEAVYVPASVGAVVDGP